MLYEKYAKAINNKDAKSEFALYHDDWQFKFHSSGHIMKKGEMNIEDRQKMLEAQRLQKRDVYMKMKI